MAEKGLPVKAESLYLALASAGLLPSQHPIDWDFLLPQTREKWERAVASAQCVTRRHGDQRPYELTGKKGNRHG